MCSLCRKALACTLALAALGLSAATAHAERTLRVCAEPNNLPYSHENGTGFENRIAELVARELRAKVAYAWSPWLRGFVRKTLNANLCDVVIGVPSDFDPVRTTRPYYRSTYVFVYRPGAGPAYDSFDDPRLAKARIGVQLIGDDLAATPPGHALALRGHIQNVVGYTVMGERPQAQRMVAAVARSLLDVALVWGPQAGYYARKEAVPLAVSLAHAPAGLSGVPFEFSISMGVRKRDAALAKELDEVIGRRSAEIQAILRSYGVPLIDAAPGQVGGSR